MKNNKTLFNIKRGETPDPKDFSIRKFSCFDFFTSTSSFIEHNFSGAIDIEFPQSAHGYVHISHHGFASFIRLLLSETYGNSVALVKIFATDTEIVILVSEIERIPSHKRLINLAERSGFSITEDGKTIILRTPLTKTQELFVFSIENLELINYLYEAFLQE